MASCFIIMPLTTPDALVPLYAKDSDHFAHVLHHLFMPALRKADFHPILPIAQGADVIHAEIIKNLETAELVLCDISSLNPNVFFELGCRTALNKPVCYVMDDLTRAIPFDTGIINHHTYDHTLVPWKLEQEIEQLSAHVRASAERSEGKNKLWEYFGLQSMARASKADGDQQDRLELLLMEVGAIKQRLDDQSNNVTINGDSYHVPSINSLTTKGDYYTALGPSGITVEGSPYFQAGTTRFGSSVGGGYVPQAGLTFLSSPKDWDKVIKDSENDLAQIALLQKPGEMRLDRSNVRAIVQEHIKSLRELIDSDLDAERKAKARLLIAQLENLRC